MSSHHIVRDYQEPALLILTDRYDERILDELLEWSPYVLIEISLLETIAARGTKVDAVLSNRSEFSPTQMELIAAQQPIDVFFNDTFDLIQHAITILVSKGASALSILSDAPTFPTVPNQFSCTLIVDRLRWVFVPTGKFFKQMEPNSAYHLAADNFITDHRSADGRIDIQKDTPFWFGELI